LLFPSSSGDIKDGDNAGECELLLDLLLLTVTLTDANCLMLLLACLERELFLLVFLLTGTRDRFALLTIILLSDFDHGNNDDSVKGATVFVVESAAAEILIVSLFMSLLRAHDTVQPELLFPYSLVFYIHSWTYLEITYLTGKNIHIRHMSISTETVFGSQFVI